MHKIPLSTLFSLLFIFIFFIEPVSDPRCDQKENGIDLLHHTHGQIKTYRRRLCRKKRGERSSELPLNWATFISTKVAALTIPLNPQKQAPTGRKEEGWRSMSLLLLPLFPVCLNPQHFFEE